MPSPPTVVGEPNAPFERWLDKLWDDIRELARRTDLQHADRRMRFANVVRSNPIRTARPASFRFPAGAITP